MEGQAKALDPHSLTIWVCGEADDATHWAESPSMHPCPAENSQPGLGASKEAMVVLQKQPDAYSACAVCQVGGSFVLAQPQMLIF